ncbi:LysR family transcriptional regulator [Phenylobacterium montanum]|uniref:LysR family transcriptional regulator n=1 Tax=Phenylobacterium montanum TaxID=2823693 RepID=A0A975G091_9CAUL|nr:LysR family transcriptional regulator [Caulobacter sp. S6]QUD88715.1 LysR family transcriptional regulator [Caulobacter sp. S6]
MDLRRLRHFEALYRLRSFARAADEVGVTQSALSRSLQKLEAELGAALFDRSTHFVIPTDSGERLIRQALDVITACAALDEEARRLREPVSGVVRAGSGAYPMQPLVTGAVAAFAGLYPGVRVTVAGGRSDVLLQGLLDRELDLVVCDMSKFDDSAFAEDITVSGLPSEPLVLIFRADHPAAGEARPDTTLYPWVLPAPSPASRERFAPALRRRLAAGTFPDFQLDSTDACLDVVRGGFCITAAPLSLARTACASGELVWRPLPPTSRTNDGVHVLRRRTQPLAVKAFIDLLKSQAKALAA